MLTNQLVLDAQVLIQSGSLLGGQESYERKHNRNEYRCCKMIWSYFTEGHVSMSCGRCEVYGKKKKDYLESHALCYYTFFTFLKVP